MPKGQNMDLYSFDLGYYFSAFYVLSSMPHTIRNKVVYLFKGQQKADRFKSYLAGP